MVSALALSRPKETNNSPKKINNLFTVIRL
jgi:hypothetical protein